MRAGLAAALLLCAAAARADDAAARKYFYEDVFRPFFALDAAAGVYRAAREGAVESSFPAAKAPGTFRVFIVGGSIARIDEGRALRARLEALLPGRTVEVIDCGMSGYDSPREELVLGEVLGYAPDAVVLMTGHNESLTRPWIPGWRLTAMEWSRRLGLARPRPPAPQPRGDARRAALAAGVDALEAAVRRMGRACAVRGVPLVVFLPPLNARDRAAAEPIPEHPAFREGWTRALAGDCPGARRAWASAGGCAASAEFLSGRCLDAEGRPADADAAYMRALAAEEPLQGRCGPVCRDALARAAAAEGAYAADAEKEFRAYAAPRLPGLDEFSDALHWRPELSGLAAKAVVSALRASPAGAGLRGEDAADCRAGPRDAQEWAVLLRSAAADLRGRGRGERSAVLLSALDYAAARRGGLDSAQLLTELEKGSSERGTAWGMPALAIPRGPYLWHLALAQLRAVRLAQAGRAFASAQKAGESSREFREDLAAYWARAGRPERAAALRARLKAEAEPYAAAGDPREQSVLWCREPDADAASRLTCARLLAAAGEPAAAAAQAERLLTAETGVSPRRQAALILQETGRLDRAVAELTALSARAPADAGVQLDAGVALFLSGRRDEALRALARAAALEKSPGDAALSYAAALESSGRAAEARAVLTDASRRADAATAGRFADALRELDAKR